ncbi:MAG: aldehyde ferredoxin oxidoreductase family protein [Candidatus Alcyoniella australis]|nr:aldehyde ferredoxin oxidoreductase family protein [Candidatus Alcyoniella australis]
MPNGYAGKVLWVDLTNKSWEEQDIDEQMVRQYMTGYGLAAKLIFDRTKPGIDPLGPENILGFATGLLSGSTAFFSGRYIVVGKSPLTGGWGDANSGGTLGPEIKKCGYDIIFFIGASDKPVYFLINDGKISIEDATDLWGIDAFETEDRLVEKTGIKRLKVASIGQSSEKLSLISGIVNDKGRLAARSGLGAVMGSKKLKAIALKGKAKTELADRDKIKEMNKKLKAYIDKGNFLYPTKPILGKTLSLAGKLTWKLKFFPRDDAMAWKQILKRYGTMGTTAMSSQNGDSPVKNWKGVGYRDFPLSSKAHKISDESLLKYQEKRYGCSFCPIHCGGEHKIEHGPYPLEWTHKPEYETLCMFGTSLLIDDLFTIYKVNDLCNRYGLDTISAGSTISFAFEAYEKGLLTDKDTDGLQLRWGNAKVLVPLIEKMAMREPGIGELLADGVKRAAEKLGRGSEEFAVHAGGQELPAHDPRYDPGFGVTYALEPTPGRHTTTGLGFAELTEVDVRFMGKRPMFSSHAKRYEYSGKGKFLQLGSTINHVANGAGICLFGLQLGKPYPIFDYLNAATGWDLTDEQWMEAGERIQNIRKAFNIREGITLEDTRVTGRVMGVPPMADGPNAGVTIDQETMYREFHEAYGWEYPSGRPTKNKLQQLKQTDLLEFYYSGE